MKVLDLFSGIGGFSLGLERAGMTTAQFVEIDPFCQAVLKQHWPKVPVHGDIKSFRGDPGQFDVICGGFPCQDISTAGKGAGLAGERSGLWSEFARLIGEVRPRYVIVENVAALLGRGLGTVLGDLASLGYDAEWHCIPASHVGAPHRRDRVWVVAYTSGNNDERASTTVGKPPRHPFRESVGDGGGFVSDAERQRQQRQGMPVISGNKTQARERQAANAFDGDIESVWSVEPDVGRVANGVPARVDRLRSLGNAVVPQIPEMIGRYIMACG